MNILVIGANEPHAVAVDMLLRSAGHAVSRHESVEGVTAFLGHDLVLLAPDFLSGERGVAALQALRSQTGLPTVVMFDHVPDDTEKKLAYDGGYGRFFTYPASREQVLGAIDRAARSARGNGNSHRGPLDVPKTAGYRHIHNVAAAAGVIPCF